MLPRHENSSPARIAVAARRLIEGDLADAAAARFSHTIFLASPFGAELAERCAFEAALKNGLGAVSLRHGRDKGAIPRRANITFRHEGVTLEVRDCVLWADGDGGRIVLVPWDARSDVHFAVGPTGLEQRPGKPAAMLGQGMSRARVRLERLARALRHEELGAGLTIVTGPVAA